MKHFLKIKSYLQYKGKTKRNVLEGFLEGEHRQKSMGSGTRQTQTHRLGLTRSRPWIPYLWIKGDIGSYVRLGVKYVAHGWCSKMWCCLALTKEVEVTQLPKDGRDPRRQREGGKVLLQTAAARNPTAMTHGVVKMSACLPTLAPLLTSQVAVSKSLTSWCLRFLICKMETLKDPIFWGC